jgi:hypothetical protein
MAFKDALAVLNELQKRKIIVDYAVCGGYAVSCYLPSTDIRDLDIIVSVKSKEIFRKLYDYCKRCNYFVIHFAPNLKGNKIENIYIGGRKVALRLGLNYVNDLPLQLIPGYTCELFEEAVSNAHWITVEGLPVKVISIEYLLATLLKAYRQKDRKRITGLLKKANIKILDGILLKHDNQEDELKSKLGKILKTK